MTQDVTVIPPQKTSGPKTLALRQWVFRLTIAFAILAPLTFILAAVGAKLGLWGWGFGLGVLTQKVGPLLLVVAGAFGVLTLIAAGLLKPRKGFTIGILAVIVATGGLMKLGSVKNTVAKLPFIHDVSTDTQNVPVFTQAIIDARQAAGAKNALDYKGKRDLRDKELVSVLQTRAYPDIRPLIMSDEPTVVFGEAKAAIRQLGWDIVSEDAQVGLIEATDTTFWYGFKDDVIIRIMPGEGGGAVLDVRSISRVGGSDIGANAARIRKFLNIMKKT